MSNRRYAADTSVSVEKTRAEIESTLNKFGAARFAYMTDEKGAKIAFWINDRSIRFELPLPSRSSREFTHRPVRGVQVINSQDECLKRWEQACRSRWRALLLCIRAKLEACACGITDFDSEFLAHIVTGDGRTIGQIAIPQMPQLTAGAPLMLS